MQNYNTVQMVICLLLISCTSPKPIEPGAGTLHTSLPAATATKTERPLPTLTLTSTLLPDPNIYNCESNVAPEDCDLQLVQEAVRIGRYYLVNNFGSDISAGIPFTLENDLNAAGRPHGSYRLVAPGNSGLESARVVINTADPLWKGYSGPAYQYRRSEGVIHELTHLWQIERGCLDPFSQNYAADFMLEGHANYVASMAMDRESELDPELALGEWLRTQFNETTWFASSAVGPLAIRSLVDKHGTMSYATWCDLVGSGKGVDNSFKTVYGVDIREFRSQFMRDLLGQAAQCTPATCGTGDSVGQYSISEFFDSSKKEPNLIAQFVDENNSPVVLSNVILCRQNTSLPSACRQPENIPGVFSAPVFSGRYAFYFCSPEYPGSGNTAQCKANETDWFDVGDHAATELTFQVPVEIEMPALSNPDLIFKLSNANGEPVTDMFVQICNYDSPVKVCTNAEKGLQTDANGIVEARLRTGTYLIRFAWPSSGYGGLTNTYEVRDIVVDQAGVQSISYQFPVANLVISFKDALGSSVPFHDFVLCRAIDQPGNCVTSASLWGWWVNTNKDGEFEANVPPGSYWIITNSDYTSVEQHVDLKVSVVASDSEVTTIEVPLNK
jgi:hypothetical protein